LRRMVRPDSARGEKSRTVRSKCAETVRGECSRTSDFPDRVADSNHAGSNDFGVDAAQVVSSPHGRVDELHRVRPEARHELFAARVRLRRDFDAVKAALKLPWTASPVEGQNSRLKMLKRTMYGRAGIELLRARVLHAT